ncbi:MAG TPA: hypothetical protein VNW15_00290 [Rhizomicrobium sp.]|nr:hypothetical protein [Rhizomicrobium sp.]
MMVPHQTWQRNRAGLTGSLLLHLLILVLWLTWSFNNPVAPAPPLKAMLVDLVNLPVVAPGNPGGAPQVARPREAQAPRISGVRPNAPTAPPDAMEARIAALANLTAPASALPAPDNDGTAGGSGSGGGYALADFVRAQILRRWWPDISSDSARGTPVAIRLKMTRAGVISDIQIVDQQRFDHDKLFRGMALSARNAAILASPIPLPPGKYDAVMDIAITLDPKAVLH